MKRIVIIVCTMLLLFEVPQAKAQYYNPYMNPQAMQQAYEWGRKMAEQLQTQQNAIDKKTTVGCVSRIVQYISVNKLDDAEEWAANLRELDEGAGCWYLGVVNELQGYSNYAKEFYTDGVSAHHAGCRQMLARLNSEGKMSSQQKANVRAYFIALEYNSALAAKQLTDEIWSGSTPTERTVYDKVSCPKCNGRKYDPTPARYSASADSYHWRGGSGCSYCNATYDHYHYRCHYCNPDGTIDKRR